MMKVGSGSHTYEWRGDWAKLPAGVTLGYTHGIVVDRDDNVFLHNQSKDAVIKFDRQGNFISSWGPEFAAGAHGMYLSNEGGTEYLYLADNARHIVVKTTLEGKEIYRIETPDLPEVYQKPEQFVPTDTAVAPNGDVYVCDGYGQPWVHQYDKTGQRIRSWGGKGQEPGKLDQPHGIWIDTRGKEPQVYVADRNNRRIQIFTLDGKHVGFVQGMLRFPCCFYQYRDEMVIPDLFGRVTILDKDNKLITHLGDTDKFNRPGWPGEYLPGYPNIPQDQRKPGEFISPHAACVDSHGDIYVVEWVSDGRVTKLVKG
jgi:hypothetical protein